MNGNAYGAYRKRDARLSGPVEWRPSVRVRPGESKKKALTIEEVERVAALTGTDESLASAFGVDQETLKRWRSDPRFLRAVERGRARLDERVVAALAQRACGMETRKVKTESFLVDGKPIRAGKRTVEEAFLAPDPNAAAFWLKNRRRDEWRERVDVNASGAFSLELVLPPRPARPGLPDGENT